MNNNTFKNLSRALMLGATALSSVGCSTKGPEFFTVENKDLKVTFCDRGASIYSIFYKGLCVTYQPDGHDAFLKSTKNAGRIVGRTCGRIDKGQMQINGKKYQFSINEHDRNTLHGGKDGIGNKDWSHTITENEEGKQVQFKYTSPDGESGYPGTVDFVITYTMPKESNSIKIDLLGTPRSNENTPICLTNHTYWRLGGSNGILDHQLKIPANYIANSRRDDQIIEEENIPIVGTTDWHKNFNFNIDGTKIGDKVDEKEDSSRRIDVVKANDPVAAGYDHGWIFNESKEQGETKNKVNLKNLETNVQLTVSTDIDMVFIYTNDHPEEGSKMLVYGEDEQYGGVAIEPMTYMNNKAKDNGDTYESIWHNNKNPFHQHIQFDLDDYQE